MWSNPKREIWRSERYLDAVRRLQVCVSCGHEGHCQAAHLGGVKHGKAGALKTPDSMAASLCTVHPGPGGASHVLENGCHEQWDQRNGRFAGLDYDETEALVYQFIAKTMILLLESGALVPR